MRGILSNNVLFLLAAGVSLLLSLWIDSHETVINPDAICYVLSAEAIKQSGWQAVFHTCGQAAWPFYSLLIFTISSASSLSSLVSAYLLDGFFSALTVVTFIAIVKELGGSKRIVWLAALVILLFHEFNSVRQYIVRDHGFWAFYLLSVFFLLRYSYQPKWFFALCFSLSLWMATLFRIEGFVFLLCLPVVVWFFKEVSLKSRSHRYLALNASIIFICLAILFWCLVYSSAILQYLGRFNEVIDLGHGLQLMFQHFQTAQHALAIHVLAPESSRDAALLFSLSLVVWYVVYAMINLSFGYTLLVMYALKYRVMTLKLKRHQLSVLAAYLLVNIGITFIFFVQHLFLAKRYLIALSFIFLLFVPFALDALISKWQEKRHRVFLVMVSVLILLSASDGIINFGYSKKYIHDAGDWIANNVPLTASLYVNDYQLMFYSHHFGLSIFQQWQNFAAMNIFKKKQWMQYDYLAIRMDRHQADKPLPSIDISPKKILMNERGDRVVIYKVKEK